MTEHEILALKAGRDLDIAVALGVMEYVWVTHMLQFSAEMEVKGRASVQEIEEAGGVVIRVSPERLHALKLRDGYEESVPHYSRDDKAAEQLWPRLEEIGWRKSEAETGWKMENSAIELRGEALPELIAKAALLRFIDKKGHA